VQSKSHQRLWNLDYLVQYKETTMENHQKPNRRRIQYFSAEKLTSASNKRTNVIQFSWDWNSIRKEMNLTCCNTRSSYLRRFQRFAEGWMIAKKIS
jgi:hypothetical protein